MSERIDDGGLRVYGGTSDYPHYSAHGETREGLRPCPFCGSTDIVVENTHTPYYTGECQDCGAQGPPAHSERYTGRHIKSRRACIREHTEAMAAGVAAWNRRGQR